MKKPLLLLFFSFISCLLFAKDGYHIEVNLKGQKNETVYLASYYGKPFPTIYKTDSAKLDNIGKAIFDHSNKIVGGIYAILSADHKGYFEFLLDNGDNFSVNADLDKIPESLAFQNSTNNDDFVAYQKFLKSNTEKGENIAGLLTVKRTKEDSIKIYDQIKDNSKQVEYYRNAYANTHASNLLTTIFQSLTLPEISTEKHYNEDGSLDSNYAFNYYKKHYWDYFNFHDDRLIHTPLLQNRLEEYFNKLNYNVDTTITDADMLLAKMKKSENLFKFTLNWLSTNAQMSKIMGMDKLFVHLVDKYYMRGDATWLTTAELEKYIDKAQKIAPTVINSPAANIQAYDLDSNIHSLYDFKAKYTLLVFFATDCSHCQHEMPILDSLYNTVLKSKGVRVIAFNVERDKQKWKDFIKQNHMEEWLNVWDPQMKSRYWAMFDVQSTPTIFLMDENKIIVGKDLNHTNILKVVNLNDEKERLKK